MSKAFWKLGALSAVRDDRTLSKVEKLVLLMLISHGKHNTRECFPSLDLLAKECGMARSAVSAAVSSLRARGAACPVQVTVGRRCRVEGRGRESNVYRLDPSPAGGLRSASPKSNGRTQVPDDLSPKIERPESKKAPDLSPAGGLEAGKEAGKICASTSEALPFALQAPSSTKAKSPRKTKNPSRHGQAYTRTVAKYFELFRREHGEDPTFGPEDGKWTNELLDKLKSKGGPDAAERRLENAFSGFRRKTVTIRSIARDPDAFASPDQSGRKNGVDVQRGGLRPELDTAACAAGDALAGE